jgi:hypothetical protein
MLEVAKDCVVALIDHLTPEDSFGLVAFDTVCPWRQSCDLQTTRTTAHAHGARLIVFWTMYRAWKWCKSWRR